MEMHLSACKFYARHVRGGGGGKEKDHGWAEKKLKKKASCLFLKGKCIYPLLRTPDIKRP